MSSKLKEQQGRAAEDRLLNIVVDAIDDMKGVDVMVIDVRDMTSITDRMVIASGTSSRHVKAIADNVELEAKREGFRALGVEGAQAAEWVLIDLGDVVVHVMMPAIREFYALEKLWAVVGDNSDDG
jgi:ribosome-associated protein